MSGPVTTYVKPLPLLLLCATLLGPLTLAAAVAAPPATLTTTIDELGYPGGLAFDDVSLPRERTLFFPLPAAMPVTAATLRIIYRGTPHFGRHAALHITIADRYEEVMPLTEGAARGEWQIAVPHEALAGGQLKVTLRSTIPTDYSRCIEGQPQGSRVMIAPESGLTSSYRGQANNLRDGWLTLPDDVVVALPGGEVDETTYRSALDWIVLLQRHHHRVRVTTLPALGDLVIAPEAEIAAALAPAGTGSKSRTTWRNGKHNIAVVKHAGGTFIAVVTPYADAQRFAAQWQSLAAAPAASIPPEPPAAVSRETRLPLEAFGLVTAPAELAHKLRWSASFSPWNLPPGMRAERAALYLAMPYTEPQKSFRIFVYLNDRLVESRRLAGDGKHHLLSVDFSEVPFSNNYRLDVVARDGGEGDCTEPTTRYRLQLLPESHVMLSESTTQPDGFAWLPTYYGHGFDLHVPRHYLADGPRYLPMLGQLITSFVVPPADYRLMVYDKRVPQRMVRSFILAGEEGPAVPEAPLRFNEGKVTLVDYAGKTLISEPRLYQGSSLELLRQEEVAGMWFRPGSADALPGIDANHLGEDDVAIFEADRLLLSLNSEQEDLARFQYPEAPRWFERLGGQRYIWMVAAWLALSLGIFYLYLKSKQHRKRHLHHIK